MYDDLPVVFIDSWEKDNITLKKLSEWRIKLKPYFSGDKRKKVLNKSLDVLNDKEKHIILKRHLNHTTLTLESVGKDLNISKERVRQLESRALIKLKKRILKTTSKQDLI